MGWLVPDREQLIERLRKQRWDRALFNEAADLIESLERKLDQAIDQRNRAEASWDEAVADGKRDAEALEILKEPTGWGENLKEAIEIVDTASANQGHVARSTVELLREGFTNAWHSCRFWAWKFERRERECQELAAVLEALTSDGAIEAHARRLYARTSSGTNWDELRPENRNRLLSRSRRDLEATLRHAQEQVGE